MSKFWKFDWRNWALALGSTLFAIVILELILRIILYADQSVLINHYQDKAFISRNKFWGSWHYPNNKVRHISDCFEATYETNSLGLKAPEIASDRPNIILLGDSYLEGYGASNDQSLIHFMDSIFGGKYNFLPFGSSGGFGTVNQYALYESFARYLKSDLVVLFWLNYNDPYDNLNAITSGLIDDELNYTFKKTASMQETTDLVREMGNAPEIGSDINLYSFNLAKKGFRSLQNISQYWTNVKGNFKDAIGQIYAKEEPPHLTRSYEITEKVLRDLHLAVTRDSSKLVVVNLFDPYQVDNGWMKIMSEKLNVTTDPLVPNQRIEAICHQIGIDYFSLYEPTMEEIKAKNMKFPYFNFACDNHLTEKGNLWVAKLVSAHLKPKLPDQSQ